jgi:hypothetical protein
LPAGVGSAAHLPLSSEFLKAVFNVIRVRAD